MAHLNESGLQAHSVGDLYPWMIVGTRGPAGETLWYAWHTIDGQRFPARAAYKDAELDVARFELALQRGRDAEASAAVEPAAAPADYDLGQAYRLVADKPVVNFPHLHHLVARATYHYMASHPNAQRLVRSALEFRGADNAGDLRLSQLEGFLDYIAQ